MVSIYTDGSYVQKNNKAACSGAFVILDNERIIDESSFLAPLDGSRNVTGEMLSVNKALFRAFHLGYKNVELFFDYTGIEFWVTGHWRAKKMNTQDYRDKVIQLQERGMKIKFTKVKGHSGDKWNDYVDKLAKAAVYKQLAL